MPVATVPGGSLGVRAGVGLPDPWSLTWVGSVVAAALVLSGRVPATLLLALSVVAGLPHGAADMDDGRRVFRSFGRRWWRPFLLGYLALVGGVLVLWWVAPGVMLLAFLALSVVHFGMQEREGGPRCWAAVVAHGGIPIVVPAIFHGGEVARLFAILAGDRASVIVAVVGGPLAVAWLISVAVAIVNRRGDVGRSGAASDLLLVGLLFAAAPPLIAFAAYFALLHTPRAFVAQWRHDPRPTFVRTGVLTTLACALGAAVFTSAPGMSLDADIVRTAFMLLAALTVPHMALDYLLRSRTAAATG